MGLDESSPGLEDVYGWICGLKTEDLPEKGLRLEIYEPRLEKRIFLCARSIGEHISLDLYLRFEDSLMSMRIGRFGTCLIVECSKKKMQQNLLPLLSRLCVYAFLGDIEDLKIGGSKKNISNEDIEELLELEIEPGTIEGGVYKPAFNNLFYAACYSRLIHGIKQDNEIEYHKAKLKEFAAKSLQIIGPEATESVMKSLVSRGSVDKLEISYSSSFDNSWKIHCYCPRLEMERRIEYKDADKATSSNQLLQCGLRLKHVVQFLADCIKVELKLGELDCKALQVDCKLPSEVEKEWCFPAKISLTVGPECNKYGVLDLSVGVSSRNPSSASVSKAKTNEIALQVEEGLGMPSLSLGYTHARTMTNWRCDRWNPKPAQGRLEWTLYHNCLHHNSSRMPVFSYRPSDNYQCKAFAAGVWSDRPFTPEGGVIFAGDMYGTPMTWWLNRDLEGETLKWFVEVEIWLAYYGTKYMEIRYKKFRELVELSLEIIHDRTL